MAKIAEHFDVNINAVTYAMRKAGIERRTIGEAQTLLFKQSPASFKIRNLETQKERDMVNIGIALYWAEGYKAPSSSGVDFANSDPSMITAFLKFLRTCYQFDENRLRVQLYAYSNQNIDELINFWSNLTSIPSKQFTKPYIRTDFKIDGRKMEYGLVHIRYSDKKMLFDILERIKVLKG